MSSYYLAPSLVTLRGEINTADPERDKTSDGWIGDASHAARKSDHNPDYPAGGVVRAIDVDKDGIDPEHLVAVAIKDSRTNYVIWNGHIWSRAYNFVKRIYTGINKHAHHVHISIRKGKTYENSTKKWGFASAVAKVKQVVTGHGDCTLLQKALGVTADNIWGDETEKAANAVRAAGQNRFPYGVKFTQEVVGAQQDGDWGPGSRGALKETIKKIQKALTVESHTTVTADGVWITQTERAYLKVRAICRK